MKSLRNVLLAFITASCVAQTPVTIKPSPTVDAFVKSVRDAQAEQKSYDQLLSQAKAQLDSAQQALNVKLNALTKALNDRLKADKKYKDDMLAVDTLANQIKTTQQEAESRFNSTVGPLQNKLNSDKALAAALLPIVRKENDLPESTTVEVIMTAATPPTTAPKSATPPTTTAPEPKK